MSVPTAQKPSSITSQRPRLRGSQKLRPSSHSRPAEFPHRAPVRNRNRSRTEKSCGKDRHQPKTASQATVAIRTAPGGRYGSASCRNPPRRTTSRERTACRLQRCGTTARKVAAIDSAVNPTASTCIASGCPNQTKMAMRRRLVGAGSGAVERIVYRDCRHSTFLRFGGAAAIRRSPRGSAAGYRRRLPQLNSIYAPTSRTKGGWQAGRAPVEAGSA